MQILTFGLVLRLRPFDIAQDKLRAGVASLLLGNKRVSYIMSGAYGPSKGY